MKELSFLILYLVVQVYPLYLLRRRHPFSQREMGLIHELVSVVVLCIPILVQFLFFEILVQFLFFEILSLAFPLMLAEELLVLLIRTEAL